MNVSLESAEYWGYAQRVVGGFFDSVVEPVFHGSYLAAFLTVTLAVGIATFLWRFFKAAVG